MFKIVSIAIHLLLLLNSTLASADGKEYSFGVINQRSITLTAEYWNPILNYISDKSGVALRLKMARNAPESSDMIGKSQFDFVYSNAIFDPINSHSGYQVFARPAGKAIKGQIVVLEDSRLQDLKELSGKEVGFPSQTAFIGYMVTLEALKQRGINVTPVFAGNQEGIMAQLKGRRVPAAGVNSQVMFEYAQREGINYRALWNSEEYFNIPISAHPKVSKTALHAVRKAILEMSQDPDGLKILQNSAAVIKQQAPYGFVAAQDKEYANYRLFFKNHPPEGRQ